MKDSKPFWMALLVALVFQITVILVVYALVEASQESKMRAYRKACNKAGFDIVNDSCVNLGERR